MQFAAGKGCKNIENAFIAKLGDYFGGYHCKDNLSGGTLLVFLAQVQRGREINEVLAAMYPDVGGGCVHQGQVKVLSVYADLDTASRFDCPDSASHVSY